MRNEKFTLKKRAWPFWLLVFITFAVLASENFGDFRMSVPNLLKASGGLPILDMRFWYTPSEAYQLFTALGPAGRADNRVLYLTVDIVIPLMCSLLLWAAISRGALRRFRYLALFGGAFDYLENISILILLANYPERLNSLVIVGSCFTIMKFLFYFVGTLLALAGLIMKLLAARKEPTISNRPLRRL